MFVAIINSHSYVKFTKKKTSDLLIFYWISVSFGRPVMWVPVPPWYIQEIAENAVPRCGAQECTLILTEGDSVGKPLRERRFQLPAGEATGIFQEHSWCPLNLGAETSNILFMFTLIPGEMIQFDEHIFQLGWFNHHLDFRYLLPGSLTVRLFSNDGS